MVEQHDAVARSLGERKILCRENGRTTAAGVRPDERPQDDDRFGIERGRSLVDQSQRSRQRKRRDDRRLPPEPMRQRPEPRVEADVEAERTGQDVEPRKPIGSGTVQRPNERAELAHAELVEPGGLVWNKRQGGPRLSRPGRISADRHATLVGTTQAGNHVEQGRFPRPVRPHETQDLVPLHHEIDAIEPDDIAVPADETANDQGKWEAA